MKILNWVFIISILGFSLYTMIASFVGWNPSYGVYGVFISMIADITYDEWKLKKMRSEAYGDKT